MKNIKASAKFVLDRKLKTSWPKEERPREEIGKLLSPEDMVNKRYRPFCSVPQAPFAQGP